MDRKKLELYSDKWNAIEKRIGGETGKATVLALKELYSIYDDAMIEWMASLYDPASGAWYHSRSGQSTEGYGPDAESTIEVFGFWRDTGMTGGRPYEEVAPQWLKEKVAKFCYGLQDEDGYFYHPQWGKQYYLDNGLTSRLSRDGDWCRHLIRLFSDGKFKYPLPSENLKAGGDRILEVPVRWRSKENYLEYLRALDLKTSSYPIGNALLAEGSERKAYGQVLGVDLDKITVDWLDENVNPETGLWQDIDDTGYNAVNALCKLTKVYCMSSRALPYPKEGLRSSMESILSDKRAGAATDTLNPWSSISNGILNIRRYGKGDGEADEMLRRVREWAPSGIRRTMEKMSLFKMPDGGMSYLLSGCCSRSQGAPVAVEGSREGDINGNCCASSAVVKYIFSALDIEDLMIPLFDEGDLRRFLDIVEEREATFQRSVAEWIG